MIETQNKAEIDSIKVLLNNNSEEIRAILNMLKTQRGAIDINYETIGILHERVNIFNNRLERLEKSNDRDSEQSRN